MAYRAAIRQHDASVAFPEPLADPAPQPESDAFSPLEEQVIQLARRDGLGSIETPTRIERLVAALFGLNVQRRALADARLETLRRAVVVTRHRRHLPDVQTAELREAGYTARQIGLIEEKALSAA